MDFNDTLKILQEANDIHVKIKGTKNADGKDLYDQYPWFSKKFPNKKNITGIIKGKSGRSIFSQSTIRVQFATFTDGKVELIGHSNNFTPEQIKEL